MKMLKQAINMMAFFNDGTIRVSKTVANGVAVTRLGVANPKGKVEVILSKGAAAEGEESAVVCYLFAEFSAAAAGEDAEVVFDGNLTVNGMALSETEPKGDVPDFTEVQKGKPVYQGPRAECPNEIAFRFPGQWAAFGETITVLDSETGTLVFDSNGVLAIRVKTAKAEKPKAEPEPDEETLAQVDAAIRSGAATYEDAVEDAEETEEPEEAETPLEEIPFDLEEPAKDEKPADPKPKKEKAEKPKKEKETKKKEETPMVNDIINAIKLFPEETAAFRITPKALAAALEHVQAVAGGAKLCIALPGEGNVICLVAYKEPIQVKVNVPVDALGGEECLAWVELDRLANIVRGLIAVENGSVRFGVTKSELTLVGEKVKFSFPIVNEAPLLNEAITNGLGMNLYPTSLSEALRASVCSAKDEKAMGGLDAILVAVTNKGNTVEVYSCDGFAVSRALVKGRAVECEDKRFSLPLAIRSIKWPDGEDAAPAQFSFGDKLVGITVPGRQYLVRYKATPMPTVEAMFGRVEGTTKVFLKSGDVKDTVNLLMAAATDADKKPVQLTINGLSVEAMIDKQRLGIDTAAATEGELQAKVALGSKMTIRTMGAFGDETLTVEIGSPKSPVLFSNAGRTVQVLQLPVKVNKA